MIETIGIALKTYATVYTGATEIYDKTRTDLHENYKGNLFADKMREAQELYNNTLNESRSAQWKACLDALDQVRDKVKEVIGRPIEGDFSATLDAVKAMKHPSRTELEAIAGRYKGNYLAYRAIVDAVGDKLTGFPMITADDVFEACDDLQALLHPCFFGGEGVTGYKFRLMLQGDLVAKYDNLFTAFMEGRFDEAGSIKDGFDNPDESDGD